MKQWLNEVGVYEVKRVAERGKVRQAMPRRHQGLEEGRPKWSVGTFDY
jgi:hypothetical protein